MGYGCQREFHLNVWHHINVARAKNDFKPEHSLLGLVACVQEEVGELAAATLGVLGEKARKSHLTNLDVLDAVADAMTYLSLIAAKVGCHDLESLLAETFNMVSERVGSARIVGSDARLDEAQAGECQFCEDKEKFEEIHP